jgi:hypothetical protein
MEIVEVNISAGDIVSCNAIEAIFIHEHATG